MFGQTSGADRLPDAMEESMKSRVMISFQEGLKVATPVQYKFIGVVPEMEDDLWKGVSVKIDHDDNATPFEIVEKARAIVRDVLTLVGVGRGLELPLGVTQIRPLSPSLSAKGVGIIEDQIGCTDRTATRGNA